MSSATFSQSSIISAGHAGKAYRGAIKIGAITVEGASVLVAGQRFLTMMQIPIVTGREVDDRDQLGSLPVAVISERLARTYFENENPPGRRIALVDDKRDLEIVGVSANLRYGGLKEEGSSMTLFTASSQSSQDLVTYALRDYVLQRRAPNQRDRNSHGVGRAARHGSLDGSAPRSTTLAALRHE